MAATETKALQDLPVDLVLAEPDRLLPAVLDHLEGHHPRGAQLHPGHSSVGRCRRAAGYGYAGTAPDEGWKPAGSVAAWIGQAIHLAFLPALRTILWPARIELATTWRPLAPGFCGEPTAWPGQPCDLAGGHPGQHHPEATAQLPPITGHVDLYRRRSQLALDLKSVSRHQLDYVRREGARAKDLLQLHANAASLTDEGKPVTTVGVLYVCTETSIDRQDGQGLLWLQAVDPDLTAAAVSWWAEVTETVDELGGVDTLPRDERGPGLSWACDDCAWLKQCWGPDARPGVVGGQQLLAVEDDAVASALQLLAEASERYTAAGRAQRDADRDRDFAAAILAGTPEGTYTGAGTAYELTWKPGQLRLDQAEAVRILADLNVGAPRKRGAAKPVAKVVDQ